MAMFLGPSTLGAACCSSGKSVKLTGHREFAQIMRPVSSMKILLVKSELLVSAAKLNN